MKEIILAYQGEMTLKGLNRAKFEARLAKIIRWRLEPLGKFKVYQAQSTVFIEPKEDGLDMDEAFRRVSHVFGIVKLSRAVECPKDFDAVCETAEAYLGETLRGVRTFKVEAKRADKAYPMKSPEICRELGAYLLINTITCGSMSTTPSWRSWSRSATMPPMSTAPRSRLRAVCPSVPAAAR